MKRLRMVFLVGAVAMAGAIGLSGSSWGLQRGSHCIGVGGSGGGTSGETIGISCCSDDGYPQPNGHGGAWCYNPDALPGQPPTNPPHDPPGHHPAGTDGDGDDDDQPECKPGERPFPPSGKIVGSSIKAGESIDLTDEWLKNHPGVEYVEYTPDEIEAFEVQIDDYMAQQAAQPKPKCKETCRSCKNNLDAAISANTKALKRCENTFTAVAISRCKAGLWRADPRDPNHGWGCDNGIGYSPECGYPNTPVQEKDCAEEIDNGRVVWRQCTLTMAMNACVASWMNELPSNSTGHTGPGGGIDIGPVKTSAWGGDTLTTTLQGRDGFKDACEHWASQELISKVAVDYESCVGRVQAAHPGVTCD